MLTIYLLKNDTTFFLFIYSYGKVVPVITYIITVTLWTVVSLPAFHFVSLEVNKTKKQLIMLLRNCKAVSSEDIPVFKKNLKEQVYLWLETPKCQKC